MNRSITFNEFNPENTDINTWIEHFLLCCELLDIKEDDQHHKICTVSIGDAVQSVLDLLPPDGKWANLVQLLKK